MKKTQRLFVLVLALCMLVQMLPVAAFEFEVPEAAEEIVEKADSAALSDDTIPGFPETTLDDSLGRLVAFWNFEGDDPGKLSWGTDGFQWASIRYYVNGKEQDTPADGVSNTITTADDGYAGLTSVAWNIKCASNTIFQLNKNISAGKYSARMKVFTKTGGTVGNPLLHNDKDGTNNNHFIQTAAQKAEGQYVTASASFTYTPVGPRTLYLRNYGTNDFVIDDFEIWSYPENSFILRPTSGSTDGEMITCTEETYAFSTTYNGSNVKIWTDGTNTYKAGVSYTAADLAGKTYFPIAYEEMPEAYDATYGQLLFYTGFNNETSKVLTNEFEANSPVKNLVITGSAKVVGNNVVSSVSKDSANFAKAIVKKTDSSVWTYSDGTNVEGKLTWFADYAFENDQTGGHGYGMLNESTPDWSKMNKNNAGVWATSAVSQSDVGGTNTQVKSVDLRYAYINDNHIYYDNFKVYIQPTNALWLTSDSTGADRTFAVISDDTYTFPTEFNGETVIAWTDGTTLWTAGSEIAKATVAAKTIYPVKVAAAPAEYDENYGQLVWFDNFSDDIGFTNIADISFVKNASDTIKVKAGYYAVQPISGNAGVKFYEFERNGDSWKYTNGKTMSGQVSILASICNESDNLPNYGVQTAATPATWNANIEGRTIGTSFTPTWNHYIRYGLAVGDNSTLAPKSGYQTIHTLPTFLDEYITKDSKQTVELSRFGLSIADTASREYYARSLAVYVKPDNALWLIDSNGNNRTYEVASDTTYTFPTNFNGTDVLTWKNGTTTYAAGETVSIADIAGKTWQVGETVGLAFDDSVSVRVSGTPGIRFKTNLNLAAYTNADEIGFLATRNKHFVEQFGGLDENLVLTNEKVNNTKYCAHASVSAANIVDTGDGETASFNAVVINVPERKATLTETLHLRSYVTCGGVTYYSAVRKESIYEAAKKISESSGYQDNDYIKNILSICEEASGN